MSRCLYHPPLKTEEISRLAIQQPLIWIFNYDLPSKLAASVDKQVLNMLTVHHLSVSQSERILFLLEELEIPYKLVKHMRDPIVSPQSLKSLPGNGTGASPFLEDSDVGRTLNESAAICEYIIHKYRNGRLAVKPNEDNYLDYLYWFHYSNGTFQPAMVDVQFGEAAGLDSSNQLQGFMYLRMKWALELVDKRLGESKYFAGDELTAADIMMMYSLTTQRYWLGPIADLSPYPNTLRWTREVADRPAYRRAMEKGTVGGYSPIALEALRLLADTQAGDPEMKLLLDAEPPKIAMMAAGGVTSDHWKK